VVGIGIDLDERGVRTEDDGAVNMGLRPIIDGFEMRFMTLFMTP
jgi:hypothetical protein